MIDPAGLTAILAAFFIVAVSPGPATLAVSSIAAAAGRWAGMLFGGGLAVGLAAWGVVAATGLGAVLQTSSHLLAALKVAGGLYLLWLAWGSARSAMLGGGTHGTGVVEGGETSGRRWFLRGLVLNLSNPKAVVAWMAALSVGLGAGDGAAALAVATAACILVGVAIYLAYALAFSLGPVMRAYVHARRWIEGVVATLFAAAGFALLRSAFTRSPA